MKAVLTGVVLVLSAVPAFAQPGMGGSAYYGEYPYVATTPAESYFRGAAEVIKDQGIYNQLTAQAARDLAQANTISIENTRKWIQMYFDMRQLNREERAAERGPRPSLSFLIRSAQEGAPRRLSSYEFDAATGQINWPLALLSEAFAGHRAQLERLFAYRATGPQQAAAFDTFIGIWQGSDRLTDALQNYVAYLPPQQYVAAKRFLQSLAWEAGQPMVAVPQQDRVIGGVPPPPPAGQQEMVSGPPAEKTAARAVRRE
jgi:hypothetical protein